MCIHFQLNIKYVDLFFPNGIRPFMMGEIWAYVDHLQDIHDGETIFIKGLESANVVGIDPFTIAWIKKINIISAIAGEPTYPFVAECGDVDDTPEEFKPIKGRQENVACVKTTWTASWPVLQPESGACNLNFAGLLLIKSVGDNEPVRTVLSRNTLESIESVQRIAKLHNGGGHA